MLMKITATLKTITLIAILITSTFNFSIAQWQQLAGYQGEPVYWVRGTTSTLFAVTSNDVVSSTNSGGQWNDIPVLSQSNTVDRISTSGDTVVAFGFPESQISLDNGQNWTAINDPATSFSITAMIIEDGILYAATSGDYIYRSTTLGASWTQVTSNFGSEYINALTSQGTTILAATDDGLYRSSNSGVTFTQAALPGSSFNRIYMSGNYAFAYSGLDGIYKSNDNGSTWTLFQPIGGLPYPDIFDFCLSGDKIFATAFDDLIVSDTSAQNWTPVNYNQDIDFSFTIHKQGTTLFAGTNRGIFTSVNQGVTWTEMNNGIIPVATEALTMLNDTLFAGSNIYGVSHYSGAGWEFSGLGLRNTFDIITHGTDLYTASDFGIYKSSDSGNNWSLINSTPGNPFITYCSRVDVSDSLIAGAAFGNGILRSGDSGVSWSFQNTGMSSQQVSSVAISGANIVAGTFSNGIYVSTDGGFNWTAAGAPGEYITDFTTIGNTVIAASFSLSGNFISFDNGATWSNGTADIFEDLSTSGSIVLGSASGYVMLSLDSGVTFQNLTPAPAGTQIVGSLVSATDVYAGTNEDGVWKITISEILSLADEQENNISALIYPNAFHDEAMIVVDEKTAAASADFIVTDVSGKLINQIKLQQTRTKFHAENMEAGIYFYTVYSRDGLSKSGKFVIY